jgi:rare lipoprotein A
MVNSPVGMMQNFFWGWRLIAGFPRSHQRPSVTVSSAPFLTKPAAKIESDCQDHASDPDLDQDLESAESGCVLPVSASAPQSITTLFQVRVKNQVVAELGSQDQANQTAQRLQQLLDQPRLNPSELHPGFDRKVPAARFRNQVLFTVDPEIAKALGSNPEILAIQWVNALRSALDEPPLSLVEGQVRMYNLRETGAEIQGLASWYGPYFHGRQTATGEIFDQDQLTTAHPSLPFDTYLKVTNRKNGKSVVVRVNDRGPYVDDRTLDLSREAARRIDSEHTGVVPVTARIMQSVPGTAPPSQSVAQL